MKKYQTTDKYLVILCIALFVFLAAGITALCFTGRETAVFGISADVAFGGISAAALAVYAGTAFFAVVAKKSLKRYAVLSVEIVFVATLIIALSPLAVVLRLVELVCEKASESNLQA